MATIQLLLPPAASVVAPITYTASTGAQVIPLDGVQTYTVDLAMMPTSGVQALLVSVDAVLSDGSTPASAPVRLNFTPGGYAMIEPGGGIGLAAPGTAVGITALELVSTASAVVRVSAYG